MEETQSVICPWCNKDLEMEFPTDEPITCPNCQKECEAWADGDIDFQSWYLTKYNDNKKGEIK